MGDELKNQSNKKNKQRSKKNEQIYDFENELFIGVNTIPTEKNVTTKHKINKKPNKKINKNKKKNKHPKNRNNNKIEKIPRENKRAKVFVKWVLIITAIIGISLLILLSPLFNILDIEVDNNKRLSQEEIIDLSGIQIGDNMFKINRFSIQNKLKQNPYIESVKLKRELPSVLHIIVNERNATYMLEMDNAQYAIINNQGYVLEISSIPQNLPKIISYKTQNLTEGSRLNDEDLGKLESVLKIMQSASINQIGDLITSINIENMNNIIIYMESEKKTIYIGDVLNINTKMLCIKAALEAEKGNEGEIFIDGKTNKEGEFLFREKV